MREVLRPQGALGGDGLLEGRRELDEEGAQGGLGGGGGLDEGQEVRQVGHEGDQRVGQLLAAVGADGEGVEGGGGVALKRVG